MKISVCIPSYNAENTITATVESLLNQTYPDFDIIITDNSDNRKTEAALIDIKDDRLRYYHNEGNIGYEPNIKRAVELSETEIVSIFHSDDIYEKDIIKEELEVLVAGKDISAVFSSNYVFFGNDLENKVSYNDKYRFLDSLNCYDSELNAYIFDKKKYFHTICELGNIFTCPTLMMKKKVFNEMDGFNRKFPSCEDVDLCFRMILAGHKIALVKKDLINYRVTESQGGAEFRKSEDLPMILNVIDHYKPEFQDILDNEIDKCHNIKKAKGFLKAAVNSAENKSGNFRKNIKLSKETYKFKAFSKAWILQNLGILFSSKLGMKILGKSLNNKYNW